MTGLLMIRHAATSWNRETRIQGLSDIPIDDDARREAVLWRLPKKFHNAVWFSSPLIRAMETARLLGGDPQPDERLIEMDWGEWEGNTLENLRSTLGDKMRDNENRGLDFRPPGGESPRDMQARIRPWLNDIARSQAQTIAVTHKGVIRAVIAMATGWNMLGKAPTRVLNAAGHVFELDEHGTPEVVELNISMVNSDEGV